MNGLSKARINELDKIFKELYPIAKKSVLYAEIETLHRNVQGWGNIRDVVDHISHLFQKDGIDYDAEIAHIKDHLQRAIIESHEMVVEDKLYNLDKRINKPRILYKITFSEIIAKQLLEDQVRNIKSHLKKGRMMKSKSKVNDTVNELKKAEEIIDDMLLDIGTPGEVKYKALILFLSIIGIIIASIMGIFL